jgi:hypothetical protein
MLPFIGAWPRRGKIFRSRKKDRHLRQKCFGHQKATSRPKRTKKPAADHRRGLPIFHE